MSTSGTTFTDWEQEGVDRRQPLFDEDFSWSEPPTRRRRLSTSESKVERRRRVEPEYDAEPAYAAEPRARYATEPASRTQPASHGESAPEADAIDLEREIDTAWGGRLSASAADTYEIVPSSFVGEAAIESSGRRTVVITGRGAAATYSVSRRRAEAGLAFHERSGFNPDRMAMWAVLLGIALLLGAIAH